MLWGRSRVLLHLYFVNSQCVFVSCRVISPIDGKSMESISSKKMFQKSEYKENGKIIRWTEVHMMILSKCWYKFIRNCSCFSHVCVCRVQVFFLQKGDHPKGGASDSAEHNRLTERIARAFCLALCPHLKLLKEDGMAKLGLRVAFESQEVRNDVVLSVSWVTTTNTCCYWLELTLSIKYHVLPPLILTFK